jgi:Protein of unknown function (DUF2752)
MGTVMSTETKSLQAPKNHWGQRVLLVLLTAVALPIGATVLYHYSPTEYTYLPCVFNKCTGYHCAGCGMTRCVHALLHGNLEQALAYNAMFVILSPFLAYGCLGVAYSLWTGRRPPWPQLPAWFATFLLVLLILFGIVRNIDVYPLNLLAPHQL